MSNRDETAGFPVLKLPRVSLRLKDDPVKGRLIHDPLRQRFVVLTPEEWVRQHFTSYLINHLGYPRSLMANEIGIKLNGMTRRCDTVVFDTSGKPLMIVEYKAPTVAITREVFNQIVRYNMVLNVRYLVVSNGLSHYCCEVDYEGRRVAFLKEIPPYVVG